MIYVLPGVPTPLETAAYWYVDSLISSSNKNTLQEVATVLRNKYGGITTTEGNRHDYLGIRWDFSVPLQVSFSMEGYINDLLFQPFKASNTPASSDLFENKPHSQALE